MRQMPLLPSEGELVFVRNYRRYRYGSVEHVRQHYRRPPTR